MEPAKNAANQGTDSMKSSSKQMEVPLAIDKSVGFVTISKAKIPTSTDYIDYSKEVAKFCLLEKPDNGNYGYYNGSRTTLYAMPTSDDSYKLCPSRCCALDSNYGNT